MINLHDRNRMRPYQPNLPGQVNLPANPRVSQYVHGIVC